MMNSKYLFVAGAPGSKWSSVVKNIYWSESFDHTDYSEERTYWHDADTPGQKQLMHLGAYWDPGMEFGTDWETVFKNDLRRDILDADFDAPFEDDDNGIRLVKSHFFCHHLNTLKDMYPRTPIVLVHRNDYDCLEWWEKCGEFNITYPDYDEYYVDLNWMWKRIKEQNAAMIEFIRQNRGRIIKLHSNLDLIRELGIEDPDELLLHDYQRKNINVYLFK